MIWPRLPLALLLAAMAWTLPVDAAGPLALVTALTTGLVLLLSLTAQVRLDLTGAPLRTLPVALRERARRSAFVRLRDPDAPGHARPRAPSAAVAAA